MNCISLLFIYLFFYEIERTKKKVKVTHSKVLDLQKKKNILFDLKISKFPFSTSNFAWIIFHLIPFNFLRSLYEVNRWKMKFRVPLNEVTSSLVNHTGISWLLFSLPPSFPFAIIISRCVLETVATVMTTTDSLQVFVLNGAFPHIYGSKCNALYFRNCVGSHCKKLYRYICVEWRSRFAAEK